METTKTFGLEEQRDAIWVKVQKRNAASAEQGRVYNQKLDAAGSKNATQLIASTAELKQANENLLAACSEVDAALDAYYDESLSKWKEKNIALHERSQELNSELRPLRQQLADLEEQARIERERIQPAVENIATQRRSHEFFIAERKRESADCVNQVLLSK